MLVRSVGQHYGKGSFLLAHPELNSGPEEADDAALQTLIEVLLDGCGEDAAGRPAWLVDFGVRETVVVALASSLGCAVTVLDPEGSPELEATRCVNEPKRPFKIFSSLAANASGLNATLPDRADPRRNSTREVPSVRFDALLPLQDSADIALLRVAPRRCCGAGAVVGALQGAGALLESRRVRCVTAEMVLDGSAEEFVREMRGLERLGYRLLHAGPLALPGLETANDGSYALYSTDAQQLQELYDTFQRIRSFDERIGHRVYGDGLSLSHDGKYFDYTDFVVACQQPLPKRLDVRDKARLRFQGGRWWPEQGGKDVDP